jgi:hypothetical protein
MTTPHAPNQKVPWAGVTALALALVAGLALAMCWYTRPPSDDAVVAEFERNAQQYAAVVHMLEKDPRVETIAETFVFATGRRHWYPGVAELGITTDRLLEYRGILKTIGAERLDRYEDGSVQFGVWGSGFAGHTHHKGVVWLTREPVATGRRRYALIRDHWYVFRVLSAAVRDPVGGARVASWSGQQSQSGRPVHEPKVTTGTRAAHRAASAANRAVA